MKIKNQATQQCIKNKPSRKNTIANKQNIQKTENKSDCKRSLRSKSAFGQDITKRINEPPATRYDYTRNAPNVLVQLPSFLKKTTAFTSEISPYEEEIIEYIIHSHDQYQFAQSYVKKLKNKTPKRKYIVQKLYKIFKNYKLRRKTLYLAVYYYDKYMSESHQKDPLKINLIADACMLIAMKYEEIYPPYLTQWAHGQEKAIIAYQSKILKILDFKLASTTAQHYLEIYQGKNPSASIEQIKLHEIVLDLYLFTANVYNYHPLKVVQEILESFRSTSFMQRDTNYEQSDLNVKQIIQRHQKIWHFLLQMEIYAKKK